MLYFDKIFLINSKKRIQWQQNNTLSLCDHARVSIYFGNLWCSRSVINNRNILPLLACSQYTWTATFDEKRRSNKERMDSDLESSRPAWFVEVHVLLSLGESFCYGRSRVLKIITSISLTEQYTVNFQTAMDKISEIHEVSYKASSMRKWIVSRYNDTQMYLSLSKQGWLRACAFRRVHRAKRSC